MNTKKIGQERISELADGELASSHLPATLASLNSDEGQNTWDVYHQIGDILRSDDMAISMSPGFAAKFSARLAAEPTILAPVLGQGHWDQKSVPMSGNEHSWLRNKRFSMQGFAVAATVAVFAYISVPQLMMAIKGAPQTPEVTTDLVAAAHGPAMAVNVSNSSIPQDEGTVLRDPEIDQYLIAHQRFSPSTYSISQYARPATFATDSNK